MAASAVGANLLLDASPASAAVAWGHPFSYREVPGSPFGMRDGRLHAGQDYPAPTGTPIYAVADGRVTVSSEDYYGWGVAVQVNHSDGFNSLYAHMDWGTRRVQYGQEVLRGTYLGNVGDTGNSFGSHLHIEIRTNGTAVDPIPYIQNAPLAGSIPEPPIFSPIYRRNNNMASFYYKTEGGLMFALAGDSPGNSANWLETADQVFANQLAAQHGNAAQLTLGTWNDWKARYLA